METIYLLLAMLAGVLIRFLLKWDSAKRYKRKFDLQLALISGGLSVVTIAFLVFVRNDISGVLPFTPFLAGVYGYTGDSLFRAMMKKFKPDIK